MSSLVFPELFFPGLNPVTGVLASFATFGVGLAIRPVGAFVFANIGDRVGRKNAMVASLIMMGVSSLLIALLPGYATLGLAASCLLILLRCVQGFSLGGESTAAQIMAMEYAPPGRRALYGAVVNMGSPAGQVLIALVLLGLRGAVGEDAFVSWAWRIPFVIGFGLAIVGYVLRRKVEESPAFREAVHRKATTDRPLATVLKTHRGHIARLAFLWAANIACSYMVTTYSLEYLKNTLRLPSTTGFTLVLVANLLGVAAIFRARLCVHLHQSAGWQPDVLRGRPAVGLDGLTLEHRGAVGGRVRAEPGPDRVHTGNQGRRLPRHDRSGAGLTSAVRAAVQAAMVTTRPRPKYRS